MGSSKGYSKGCAVTSAISCYQLKFPTIIFDRIVTKLEIGRFKLSEFEGTTHIAALRKLTLDDENTVYVNLSPKISQIVFLLFAKFLIDIEILF